jgi:hypothetical protein
MTGEMKKIGRIAMRVEGTNWNAYYALEETLDGAVFLGSLPMRFAEKPVRKEAFLSLMRECLGDLMEELIGTRPEWKKPQPAPEHERTKE